jgi:hypothetical protein
MDENSMIFGFGPGEGKHARRLPARLNRNNKLEKKNQLMAMGWFRRGFRYQQGWSPK